MLLKTLHTEFLGSSSVFVLAAKHQSALMHLYACGMRVLASCSKSGARSAVCSVLLEPQAILLPGNREEW